MIIFLILTYLACYHYTFILLSLSICITTNNYNMYFYDIYQLCRLFETIT